MIQHPLDTLTARGLVQDVTDTDALRALLDDGPVTFYVGFDPTTPSLHIGHLLGMIAMGWLQRAGHRAIALVGGGTARIGDPSGRDTERMLLDDDAVEHNIAGLRRQIERVVDLSPGRGIMLDNHEWLGAFGFIEFLRDVGKHFSVNQMISKESVRRRLEEREQGISFTEFSYQLLQAYDFAHLNANHDCRLQLGGSDQWGNITAGVDLTRRLHGVEVEGIVWSLIERSDGKKMSASTGEALWLDPDLTSPYAFYQWFFNLPDADAGTFLRLYTYLPEDDIAELEQVTLEDPAARTAQRTLATEITRLIHGPEGLEEAEQATRILFGDEPFAALDDRTLADAFTGAPSADISAGRFSEGLGVISVMTEIGAARSRGEARRLIEQGGVRVNNLRITEHEQVLGTEHIAGSSTIVVRVGKKRYFLGRLV